MDVEQSRTLVVSRAPLIATGLGLLVKAEVRQLAAVTQDSDPPGWTPAVVVLVAAGSAVEALDDLRACRGIWPDARYVVVAPFRSREEVAAAVGDGAVAVVSVDSSFEVLAEAVECARDARRYACPAVSQLLIRSLTDEGPALFKARVREPGRLTERERTVLRWICDGSTDRATATAMGISESTVRSHRDRIMAKLGVRGAAQLVRVALEQRLV